MILHGFVNRTLYGLSLIISQNQPGNRMSTVLMGIVDNSLKSFCQEKNAIVQKKFLAE